MDANRIAVPGSLSIATKIRMAYQGFLINLYTGAAVAIVAVVAVYMYHPPVAQISDVLPAENAQIGAGFCIQDALSRNGMVFLDVRPAALKKLPKLEPQLQQLLDAEIAATESKYWHQYYLYLYALIAGFVAGFGGMLYLSKAETKRRSEDQFVRGAKLTTAKKLNKQTRAKGGRYTIGGVCIPKHTEILTKIYVGRPQQGKSTAIKSDIDQHRTSNVGRHVVLCTKGDFTSTHFRSGTDIMFAPGVDKNTLRWNLFADLKSPEQISAYAEALIPAATGNGAIFSQGARLIFEGILVHCLQTGKTTNSQLWDVCCLPLAELSVVLNQTPGAEQGAALIAKPTDQPAPSFHSNLMTALKPLSILAKLDGNFSVKKWLKEGTGDLFVAAKPDILPTIAPLLSLFLHVLLEAHKSLDDDRDRRIWYVLDELCVLPKIPGLDSASNFGPSKGLCLTIGCQSYFQIDEKYSQPTRRSLVSGAGCHVFYSVGDPQMAKEASSIIGSADLIVNRQTISTGVQDSRDGGNTSDQDSTKAVVSPDQIMDLQPLHAYLRILGYPAAPVDIPYVAYPEINKMEADPQFELGTWLKSFRDKSNSIVEDVEPAPKPVPVSVPEPTPVVVEVVEEQIQASKPIPTPPTADQGGGELW